MTLTAMALLVSATFAGSAVAANLGTPISEADVAAWDIDISTSTGEGLPDGQGTVAEGAAIFEEKCVACHGENADGGSVYGSMVGGIGSMTEPKRRLTPGSMYPYAPILFDYVRRAMPMDSPQSLTDNEVYALAAYLYNLNGLVPDDATMNAETLAAIEMPNRDGFMVDDRPDVTSTRCMNDCPPLEPIIKQ
jgi:cytochrome c